MHELAITESTMQILAVSTTGGDGLQAWYDWLRDARRSAGAERPSC
jgi:hypothetical protein